jgi:predicted Fe-Mo cluster-binding NifX family protein
MIVAIPASEKRVDSGIDERFARCPFFCFYNMKTREVVFKENDLRNASEGVGPQVAEYLAKNGINEVYAAEVGPKARNILDRLNIKTTIIKSGLTIQQVIDMLNN